MILPVVEISPPLKTRLAAPYPEADWEVATVTAVPPLHKVAILLALPVVRVAVERFAVEASA